MARYVSPVALAAVALLAACSGLFDGEPDVVELSLTPDSLVTKPSHYQHHTISAIVARNGKRLLDVEATWKEIDPADIIALSTPVDQLGNPRELYRKVLALKPGTARIVASYGGASDTVTVRVPAPVLKLRLSPDSVALLAWYDVAHVAAIVTLDSVELIAIAAEWVEIDPDEVIFLSVPHISGNYQGIRREVRANRPGTARIVASYQGRSDTIPVRAEFPPP